MRILLGILNTLTKHAEARFDLLNSEELGNNKIHLFPVTVKPIVLNKCSMDRRTGDFLKKG